LLHRFDYACTQDWFKAIKASLGGIQNAGEFLEPLNTTDYSTVIGQLIANSSAS
jgi:branched-chain amino acid transport system substrate-binding protein